MNEKVNVLPKSCDSCVHFDFITTCCPAFPKGAPIPYIYGFYEHLTPHPGDNGIMYEPATKEQFIRKLKDAAERQAQMREQK